MAADKEHWTRVLQRIDYALKQRGLGRERAARMAGLGPTAIKDMFRTDRPSVPSIQNFMEICQVANITFEEAWYGSEDRSTRIPIIGCAAAGEEWPAFDDQIGDLALAAAPDSVALEVRGNSMAPVYRDGDVLVGERRSGRSADNLIGLDSIAMTTDGGRYVKLLARGSKPGVFTLQSYNRTYPDIENVALAWAAPVVWVRRGGRT